MGRETKFGLLIGLFFIVLFGIILSNRAGSAAPEHAALATGESEGHRQKAVAVGEQIDPFMKPTALTVDEPGPAVPGAAEPPEERLPAPKTDELASPPPTSPPPDEGMVAFGPAVIETPTDRQQVDPRGREDVVANQSGSPSAAPAVLPASQPAGGRMHLVRPGETLTSIARQYYGKDGDRLWRRIYEANKSSVRDANRLAAGQKLFIPGLASEVGQDQPTGGPAAPAAPAVPRQIAPAPDGPPRKTPVSADIPDTYLVDGRRADPRPSVKQVPEELRKVTVPQKSAPALDGVRDVTAEDLAKMLGAQSDFTEQPVRGADTYTVRPGDTFYKIAERLYGDKSLGRLLALHNKHQVPDETKLRVGQRIVLLGGVEKKTPASEMAVAKR